MKLNLPRIGFVILAIALFIGIVVSILPKIDTNIMNKHANIKGVLGTKSGWTPPLMYSAQTQTGERIFVIDYNPAFVKPNEKPSDKADRSGVTK